MRTKTITTTSGLKLELLIFKPRKKNSHHSIKTNGSYYSAKELCKKEGADYPRYKYWRSQGRRRKEAIELAKQNHHPQRTYEYNGKTYNQTQLAEVLSKEVGITKGGMRNRLKKGLSIEECKVPLRTNHLFKKKI